MTKTVALLDVDHTLLLDADEFGNDIYNENLLNALKEKNITDVYLFTDMVLSPESVSERKKLIKLLQEKGFVVHGVLIPADYTWHLPLSTMEGFLREFDEKEINMQREGKNLDKLPPLIESYHEISNLINGKPPANNSGRVFRLGEDPNQELSQELRVKCSSCKSIADVISLQRNLASVKGLMFEQLLQDTTGEFDSCIIFDDKEECLQGVEQANANSKFPIKTIQVKKDDTQATYDDQINEHLYELEKQQFLAQLDKHTGTATFTKGQELFLEAEKLKKDPRNDVAVLTAVLRQSTEIFAKPTVQNLMSYKYLADNAQGKSSHWKKIAGIMLVLLGIVATAACLAGALPSHGLSLFGLKFSINLLGYGGAILCGVGAVGFFAHGRQKGLSKKMHELADLRLESLDNKAKIVNEDQDDSIVSQPTT